MDDKPILYLGDTRLDAAASYLGGMIARAGYAFDYVPTGEPAAVELFEQPRKLFIFSDFEAATTPPAAQQALLQQLDAGAGLLMIGGWESFHGATGHWAGQPLADALPVEISDTDDRINYDQAAVLRRAVGEHPILRGLPWDERPPLIGGFNRLRAKSGSQVLLEVVLHRVRRAGEGFEFAQAATHPLLTVFENEQANNFRGRGRVAALACDLAPHWVGPLVDWGTDNETSPTAGGRAAGQAPTPGAGAGDVEVGACYARFVTQLLEWVGRLS